MMPLWRWRGSLFRINFLALYFHSLLVYFSSSYLKTAIRSMQLAIEILFKKCAFWLFSQPKLVQTFNVGGVSESSGPSLDDGHRDFENQCRNAGENWSWCCQPSLGNWKNGKKMMSVFLVPTSTSIFSGISASIFKISVPIMKRRSWGFRNTPNLQSLDEFQPRKQPKTKWYKYCF